MKVLCDYLYLRASKGTGAGEPLVGHDAQCVLVTCWTGFTLQLLRCHVGDRPGHVLCPE